MVCWGRVVDWSWLVCWGSLVSWLVFWVVGLTLVPDISNIARVAIGNRVGHNLGATIGKNNTVFTRGGISVPLLVLSKVGSRVAVSHSVVVSIDCRDIGIGWLLVGWSRVVWGWPVWGIVGSSQGKEAKGNDGLQNKCFNGYRLPKSFCLLIIGLQGFFFGIKL